MTTLLSTTQEDILELANTREDGMVLPFPEDIKLKGGAAKKVLDSLFSKGFIKKEADDYIITNMGRKAIDADIKEEHIEAGESEEQKPEVEETAKEEPESIIEKVKPVPSDKTGKTPKGKLGKILELLKREEGATVNDLMEATGWQKHSVRGAISGQLKTKYGFTIQQIASKDKETVYQIAS